MGMVKVNTILSRVFIKNETVDQTYFITPNAVIDFRTDFDALYAEHVENVICNTLNEFQEEDSGWDLSEIILLEVATRLNYHRKIIPTINIIIRKMMMRNTLMLKIFDINLADNSVLHMRTDTLFLAGVMETSRESNLKTHGLDSAWYHTMPEHTWDCMLKEANCKLLT
ncbi:hypothetical protein JTB14_022277 [Gonioctena quinquepunctata]|nr:hypothetical protein JTB14_022277 [Gonioctena quinquepunctata]